MEIITDIFHTKLDSRTAVAMGKFDGLHRGHSRLLQEILQKKEEGFKACVFTFDPSPAVFFGFSDGKELMTKAEKQKFLESMGVDILVEYPMTKESASVEPEKFVREILSEGLNMAFVAAGTDVSFGNKGAGNAQLLQSLSEELNYQMKTIDKITLDGVEISSSLVRKAVEAGDMPYVEKLLGKPYMVTGTVQHGRALGRKLGMPTVNLLPPKEKLLPPKGVYYSRVLYKGQEYFAISNIGYKPTVSTEAVLGIETYLYDFEEVIYDEYIEVQLLEFKRPEMCFHNVDELKAQMERDIADGKRYHLSKRG